MSLLRKSWIFLLLLAFLPSHAKAYVDPGVACGSAAAAKNVANGGTITCRIASTTSGQKILIGGLITGTAQSTSCTEACTCPAGAAISHTYSGTNYVLFGCYVDTASSHTPFTVTVTVTCSTCGTAYLEARATTGLSSSIDTGGEAAAAAATTSFTTTNPSEWVYSLTFDLAGSMAPGTGFGQLLALNQNLIIGNQDSRVMSQLMPSAPSGANTAAFSSTNSASRPLIIVMPFQVTGVTAPAAKIVQSCAYLNPATDSNTAVNCQLTNVVAGNTAVFTYASADTGGVLSPVCQAGESCFCPASASFSQNYGGGFVRDSGICYVVFSSSHATFTIGAGGGNFSQLAFQGYEVSGLGALDTGSEAAVGNATSVSFMTAAANEYAIAYASADTSPLTLAPGSGWAEDNYMVIPNPNGTMMTHQTFVSSGSHTANFTSSGTIFVNTQVMAFSLTPNAAATQIGGFLVGP